VSAGRPPHLILPDEVDAWLAGSAIKVVTYHRTSVLGARSILERGVDIARSRIGAYGRGFYTATQSDPFFGEVELAVALRLEHPLRGDEDSISDLVSMIAVRLGDRTGRISPAIAEAIRQELLQLGYDGIVVVDAGGDGIDYIIALQEDAVRVVLQ
jgi:hypothetical protein